MLDIPQCHPLSLRRAALELWKQRHGSDATYNNLIEVFETTGHRDIADFIKRTAGSFFFYQ